MINTLLDSDLYKFTMMAFAHSIGNVNVKYRLKCRNNADLSNIIEPLKQQCSKLLNLSLTRDEIGYLNSLTSNKLKFLEYVEKSPLNASKFTIEYVENNLDITVEGEWWQTILFEVPILALVNEIFNDITYSEEQRHKFEKEGNRRLTEKIELLNKNPNVEIMEFGTRRRYSKNWQEHVLSRLLTETDNIIGTSNIELARRFDIKPLGSMAHESFSVYQAISHPVDSQTEMLYEWLRFWGHQYLTALTDIFPQKKFLKDFTKMLATYYTGVRHDSGDPKVWCREIIDHYISLGIDPKTKTAIFSDGLNIPQCIELYNEFHNDINVIFGVGTNLTNDMGEEHTALQVVMKIVEVNRRPVAKLSNNPGKSMCEDPLYVTWLRHAIDEDIKNGK